MDLLHRIRWPNVARALALATAILLLAAWPRLRADPPPLPPQPKIEEARAAPAGDEFALEGPPPAERAGAERRAPVEKPRPKKRRARKAKPARRPAARRAAGGTDPVAQVPLPTGATGSVPSGGHGSQGTAEFSFEDR